MSNRERLYELMERYQRRACSPQEERELAFLCLLPSNQSVLEDLSERLWEEVEMGKEMPEGDDLLLRILHRPVVRKMMWWKVAVAVCLLVVGWWFLVRGPKSGESEVGGPETVVVKQDVAAPQSSKAMVLLADGRQVSLDSLQNGLLADQDGMQLIKLADGSIKYKVDGLRTSDAGPLTNTLTNPRGSKVIDLTLSDGTRVWLNAGSSITYPVSFLRSERRVEMTGEGYFEVRSQESGVGSQKKPFIVQKGDMQVQVLGTHFNVNAYDDEGDIKVTLLEGSVEVSHKATKNTKRIKPGEQAQAGVSGQVSVVRDVDVEQVMAWKNGFFQFNRSSLQEVMRQVERWYDVEVVYEGSVPTRQFGGKISRTANVSNVLKILEESKVHFRIEGRKLTVMP